MRHGIAPISGVPPIDPATLFFDFIYRDVLTSMQDNLGGSASVDELISLWGDYSGLGNDATEATNYPTIRSNGMQAGTNISMLCGSSVVLNGVFQMYAVVTRSAATSSHIAAQSAGGGTISIVSDDNLYYINDAGAWVNAPFNATGTFLLEVVRDAGNVIKATATGVAQTTIGTTATTLTVSEIMGRRGAGSSKWSDSTVRFRFIGLKAGFILSTPQRNGLLSWFQQNYGVTL